MLVAVGVGLAFWLGLFRGSGTPVTVAAARDTAAGRQVYVYATTGFESVDALLGSRHDYPAQTTITVGEGGCGLLLEWRPLRERTTTWDLCRDGDRVGLAGWRETHRFLGQTERTTYRCDAPIAWLAGNDDPATGICSTGDSKARLTVTRPEPGAVLRVGGTDVPVVHVHVQEELSGRSRGTSVLDLWLRADGLPVRVVMRNDSRSSSPIGDVRYAERAELRLVARDPVP